MQSTVKAPGSSEADKILEARAKLAEKFGDGTRTGGKGSQRRKHKAVHHTQLNDDKKLKSIIKKFNVHPLNDISEVNMFKDDGTILNFKNPEVMASLPSNTLVVIGKSDTKSVKDLLPDIIQHLGPKQFESLKDLIKTTKRPAESGIKEQPGEEEEDIPNLVNQNFEDKAKDTTEKL